MASAGRLAHDWFPVDPPENLTLGEKSWLYSAYAFIHYKSAHPAAVQIGHDTGVYSGTFFDLGPQGEVVIGDYCSLVGAIFSTNGRITIGSYTFVAHEVVFADSFAATPSPGAAGGSIEIGENVWIGMRAVVLAPARIGDGAVIGAGAVVQGDVPAFSIVAGNPAKIVGQARPKLI